MAALNCTTCINDVGVYFRVSPCGTCNDEPIQPWHKFQKGCVGGDASIQEDREEITSSNTRGTEVCSATVSNGGNFTASTDLDWGKHQPLWEGVFGSREVPLPDTGAGGVMTTVGNNVLSSTTIDFNDFFQVGMFVQLSGFADPNNNSDPASHGGDYWHYYMVSDITDPAVSPSEMTLCTFGQTDLFAPDLVAGDTGGQVVALSRVWEGSNDTRTVTYQTVLQSSSGVIVQGLRNALLSSVTFNFSPDQLVTTEIAATGGGFDILKDFEGFATESAVCETCCDNVRFAVDQGNVQIGYGCTAICLTDSSVTLNRNPNTEKTSCGPINSTGAYDLEVSITAILGSGETPTQFLEDLRDNVSGLLWLAWWDDKFERFQYITIPDAKITSAPISANDGECAKISLTIKAQSGCGKSIVFGGSNFVPEIPVENIVTFCSTATAIAPVVTGNGGDLFGDYDADNVVDFTGAALAPHTYTDGLVEHTGYIYDLDTTAWTDFAMPGSGITLIDVCSLKGIATLDLSGNLLTDIDLDNMTSLTTIDLSNNPNLSCISVEGSYLLTTLDLTGTALDGFCIEQLLTQLVNNGAAGGTLTLPAGTVYSPTAQARINQLIANGWTVTP